MKESTELGLDGDKAKHLVNFIILIKLFLLGIRLERTIQLSENKQAIKSKQ